jgi:hypothetical protein
MTLSVEKFRARKQGAGVETGIAAGTTDAGY